VESIPVELRDLSQWVLWRYEQANGGWTKVPYGITAARASSTDQATWCQFHNAIRAAKRYHGVGFVVTKPDPFVGVDLDHCLNNGSPDPWAADIVKALDSYTERTPSGDGLRVWVRGTWEHGHKVKVGRGALEVYDSARYFTVTGQHLEGTPTTIEARQEQLEDLAEDYFIKAEAKPQAVASPLPPLDLTDEELLAKARTAANGAKFSRLWAGDTSDYSGDESSADLALCSMLAFWTGRDAGRMDGLFRRSGLMREKWDTRRAASTYGAVTIEKAIAGTAETYERKPPLDEAKIVSAKPPEPLVEVPAETFLPFKTAFEVARETTERPSFVIEGIAPRGGILSFEGKVKQGKTTVLTCGLRAVLDGSPFLGLATERTGVVYLTEQGPSSFREALRRADLLDREDFVVLFMADVAMLEWPVIVAAAAAECRRRNAGALVVDTLSAFARIEDENDATAALAALRPLQEVAAKDNLAVIVVRHERKGGGEVADSGRGSSALAGGVDIVMSIRRPDGQTRPSVRILRSLSRYDETPDGLVVEWQPTAGYVALGTEAAVKITEARKAIMDICPSSSGQAIPLDAMVEVTKAGRSTTQTAAAALVDEGLLARGGSGKRGDKYVFWAPFVSARTSTMGVGGPTEMEEMF
jgi:hypothetical protein